MSESTRVSYLALGVVFIVFNTLLMVVGDDYSIVWCLISLACGVYLVVTQGLCLWLDRNKVNGRS